MLILSTLHSRVIFVLFFINKIYSLIVKISHLMRIVRENPEINQRWKSPRSAKMNRNWVFHKRSWIIEKIVSVNYRSSPRAGLWMQEKDNIHPFVVLGTFQVYFLLRTRFRKGSLYLQYRQGLRNVMAKVWEIIGNNCNEIYLALDNQFYRSFVELFTRDMLLNKLSD